MRWVLSWRSLHRQLERPSAPEPPGSVLAAVRAWLLAFVLYQIACQVALLFEPSAASACWCAPPLRPAAWPAGAAARAGTAPPGAALGRGGPRDGRPRLVHPSTNSLVAGVAHLAMYVAIMAPLVWVSRLAVTPVVLRRLLLILWAFHTLSAAVGVLQMHYPAGSSQMSRARSSGWVNLPRRYKIHLANGQEVWRPMGLTDHAWGRRRGRPVRGAVCLGFLIHSRSPGMRLLSLGSLTVGLFCLYISEVRSLLVMAGICSLTLIAILMWRRGTAAPGRRGPGRARAGRDHLPVGDHRRWRRDAQPPGLAGGRPASRRVLRNRATSWSRRSTNFCRSTRSGRGCPLGHDAGYFGTSQTRTVRPSGSRSSGPGGCSTEAPR